MKTGAKIELLQLAAAIVLLALGLARIILWPDLAPRMDATFLVLILVGLGLLVFPLGTIKSLKAGGVELILNAPPVQGAVASLNLGRIEDVKLRSKLGLISHVLPGIPGSKLLWIDDRPENTVNERRLLRALGVTIVSAISSEQAREILRADRDFDLIVSDVQRRGDTHKTTGGEPIHEGVNFIVWLRTRSHEEFDDKVVGQIPVIFYAAYDWSRLVQFTAPARALPPEPEISNSPADFVPKVLLRLAESQTAIIVADIKRPTTPR